MQSLKLIELLQSLTLKEFNDFGKTLPQNNIHGKFYAHLKSIHPNFNPDKLKKEKVYELLFGKHAHYNDLKMRHLMSQMYILAEDFISQQRLNKDDLYKQIKFLGFLRERKLYSHYEFAIKRIKNEIENQPNRGNDYYFYKFLIDTEMGKFIETKQDRSLEPNLQGVSDNIDVFYIINKLKIFCSALNYKNITSVNYDIRLINEIIQSIRPTDYKQFPLLKLYHLSFLTLTDGENTKHFYSLKKSLFENQKQIPKEELNDLYKLARNYGIKRSNSGDKAFVREVFDLYKSELENQNNKFKQEMIPSLYKNIVSLAIKLKELEWVYSFIENYKTNLPKDQQESSYYFCMAKYYFARKEYKKVVSLLSKVETGDVFLQLATKELLLKTYFDQKEIVSLYSLIQSFKTLLKRKTILAYHRTNYMNFLKYTNQLLKLDAWDTEERNNLKKKIQNEKLLVDKDWLLDKIELD